MDKTFCNPVIDEDAGDPWMVAHGGWYYFTATVDDGGVQLWRSRRMTDWREAERKRVWTAPSEGPMSREIWAPELHWLRGRWYIYFTATDGPNERHRMFVIQSQGNDPWGPYGEAERVQPGNEGFAIDGSVLEMPDGRLYWMWCGHGGLWIAPMESPWRAQAEGVCFARGTLDWERTTERDGAGGWKPMDFYWLEGPVVLQSDGRVFVAYSAGSTFTPDYRVGLLELVGDDPMNPGHWRKEPEPLLQPVEGAWCTGHNGFVCSPDGKETWMVYHGKDHLDEPGEPRTVRIQRVEWGKDGRPRPMRAVPRGVRLVVPSGEA